MQIRKEKILVYILTILISSLFLISNSFSIQSSYNSNNNEPHFTSPIWHFTNSPSNEIQSINNYMSPNLNKKITQQNFRITIYSPFGLNIINHTQTENKDTNKPLTPVTIKFIDITSNTYLQKENFCLIGGWYSYGLKSNPEHGGFFSSINPLFYCYTIKDLISNIKIPTTWKDDNLLLYCNDGNKINSVTNNFAIFQIGDYKTCILKDLQKNGTIMYGLDSGNTILDNINSNYYNTTNHNGSIIIAQKFKYNASATKKLNKKDETVFNYNNKQYYFWYKEGLANMFILTNQNLVLNYSITKIFPNTSDIGLSRVALFKSFSNKYKIYGYEEPTFLLTPNHRGNDLPTYIISTSSNLPIPKYICKNMLASYNPVDISSFTSSTKVVCETNQIRINALAIDPQYGHEDQGGGNLGTVNSFKLFENIIFQITK